MFQIINPVNSLVSEFTSQNSSTISFTSLGDTFVSAAISVKNKITDLMSHLGNLFVDLQSRFKKPSQSIEQDCDVSDTSERSGDVIQKTTFFDSNIYYNIRQQQQQQQQQQHGFCSMRYLSLHAHQLTGFAPSNGCHVNILNYLLTGLVQGDQYKLPSPLIRVSRV
ncbi:unnamed protein product [Ambrosiozyma monospora]|uniref:Unnamed protein product n=1 Tax=Ambrosiozyma monospora TaxID=43982 RepID=A0A9W6YUV9_AMBMO|nr:unnamed protein product [Ambrosiozyma monospora]